MTCDNKHLFIIIGIEKRILCVVFSSGFSFGFKKEFGLVTSPPLCNFFAKVCLTITFFINKLDKKRRKANKKILFGICFGICGIYISSSAF